MNKEKDTMQTYANEVVSGGKGPKINILKGFLLRFKKYIPVAAALIFGALASQMYNNKESVKTLTKDFNFQDIPPVKEVTKVTKVVEVPKYVTKKIVVPKIKYVTKVVEVPKYITKDIYKHIHLQRGKGVACIKEETDVKIVFKCRCYDTPLQ